MSRTRSRAPGGRAVDADAAARTAYATAEQGNLQAAIGHFRAALAAAPGNAALRHDLAEVLAATGALAEAIEQLTEALARDPALSISAQRLAGLLSRYQPADPSGLSRKGLEAAMACPGIDWLPLTRAAIAVAKGRKPLAPVLDLGRRQGWDAAARHLLSRRGRGTLGDQLLREALAKGINHDVEVERLLTALRKALLCQATADDLRQKTVYEFACALARQCANNEFVFRVSDEERRHLDALAARRSDGPGVGSEAVQDLMRLALYHPVDRIPGVPAADRDLARLRPRALGDLVAEALAARREEEAIAETIAELRPLRDRVSRQVAAQYEASPYPRWPTTAIPPPGSKRDHLRRFVDDEALAVFGRPFDVLVAGCGTGRHAVQAAFGYGPGGRVLATDLSRASLAYAARMARALEAPNLRFLKADILDMADLGETFDVIECVGVLHHMADPGIGWRILAGRLRDGGLMRIGLYSELGRQDIARFRAEVGADIGADDDTIRRVRGDILDGRHGALGTALATRGDFFTLSACRDLLFHVQEHRFTVPGIKDHLAELGLEFRGFDVPPHVRDAFRHRFPDDAAWRDLDCWADFERDRPETFRSMYRFWCRKGRGVAG